MKAHCMGQISRSGFRAESCSPFLCFLNYHSQVRKDDLFAHLPVPPASSGRASDPAWWSKGATWALMLGGIGGRRRRRQQRMRWLDGLGSITMNKASGSDGIPVELFQILPGREAALAWASLAQRFPASSVLARLPTLSCDNQMSPDIV